MAFKYSMWLKFNEARTLKILPLLNCSNNVNNVRKVWYLPVSAQKLDALGPHVADDVERPRRGVGDVGVITGRQFVDELVEVNLHRLLAQLIHHLPEQKSMTPLLCHGQCHLSITSRSMSPPYYVKVNVTSLFCQGQCHLSIMSWSMSRLLCQSQGHLYYVNVMVSHLSCQGHLSIIKVTSLSSQYFW